MIPSILMKKKFHRKLFKKRRISPKKTVRTKVLLHQQNHEESMQASTINFLCMRINK